MATESNKVFMRNCSNVPQSLRLPGKSIVLKPGAIMEIDTAQLNIREVALLLEDRQLTIISDTAKKHHIQYQTALKKSKNRQPEKSTARKSTKKTSSASSLSASGDSKLRDTSTEPQS